MLLKVFQPYSYIYILRRQKIKKVISSVLAFKHTFLGFFVAPVSTFLKIDLLCFMVLLLSALNLTTRFLAASIYTILSRIISDFAPLSTKGLS